MMYKVCSNRSFLRARLWLLSLVLLLPIRMMGAGFTPTEGGLVVNLKPQDKILISVMVDHDNNPATPDREYFVENYTRYTGDDYFTYSAGYFLKLVQQEAGATKPSEMSIWTVDTALTRVDNGGAVVRNRDFSLGGISYTIWNDGKTLKTANDRWRFYGDLEENHSNDRLCDVVFVIPTARNGITSFDPRRTLTTPARTDRTERDDQLSDGRFNGKTGTGFMGMTYREVYWLEIPRFNGPVSYTNAALVTFNTTLSPVRWSAVGQEVASGRAGYIYADSTSQKPHHLTPRTIFRLYILNDPIVTCPDSYFFAYDEQDFKKYRKTNNVPGNSSDSTTAKKIYTMDHLFRMDQVGEMQYYKTGLMNVPVPDSSYYYVGRNDDYRAALSSQTLNVNGGHSQFTKIRTLPMNNLAGFNAPAGAYGRMIGDTTSSADNLNVKFEPAGYFLKVSTGTNVRMRQVDETHWITEEMWTITPAWAALQIKATLMTGPTFSDTDPGADIAGWSVNVYGTDVPVSDGTSVVNKSGYARITTSSTDQNGHLEFVLVDASKHIHYDNNGFLGLQLSDQYPLDGDPSVIVESPRIKSEYTFLGWNTAADGSGDPYMPGDTYTFAGDGEVTLYAQGTYDGTYNVALSFIHPTDGKRYFMTHPGTAAPRYSRARHYDDWTNVWQGMEGAANTNPLYLNSFELRHPANEVKAYQDDIPAAERHLETGEFCLAPRHYTMKGAVDSLTFYENFTPPKEEFLGLYYGAGLNTILANTTWAGLFRTTSTATSTGWPDYKLPYIPSTKLYSTRYVEEEDPENHPDSLTLKIRGNNASGTYVQYKPATDQFDGVVAEGDGTNFQITAIVVADEHYVVLPDTTTTTWRDEVVFDATSSPHQHEQVWSSLIGKQLMACMMVDGDTIYFHPNRDKILTTANDLRLSEDFCLTQSFTFIPDARVTTVDEDDRPSMEETGNAFSRYIVSGHESPINVRYAGNYIDIVDTLRIRLTEAGGSKIKKYYGRWKNGAAGLHVSGTSRYRDVLVRTKTLHYGAPQTHLVLTPENDSYFFNPLAGSTQQINFTLTKVTGRPLLDVEGNVVREEVVSTEDVTSSLALTPGACSFATGGLFGVYNSDAVLQHVTIATLTENVEDNNRDTLIISTTVRIEGVNYPATARVPLVQTSLAGDELIWSVMSGTQRYYIMAGTDGLIFRKYKQSGSTLYKEGTSTALVKGSADATNSDAKYITPWHFRYKPGDMTQLSLKTEDGINRWLKMLGDAVGSNAGIDDHDSTFFSFPYVNVYINSNGNYEEQVKMQYGADKWLKFTLTDGSGAELKLVDSEEEASVFSWSYLLQEHSLLNNGTYPSRDSLVFGYNTNMSIAVQTRYKAYKEYSMLVGNKVVYLCRTDENDIADLVNADLEWKTSYEITRIPDARDFDGSPDPVSGLSNTLNTSNLQTTVSTSGATTSPTNVMIDGKYVNIVDTLHVKFSLQRNAPEYRFKDKWSSFKSIDDAELKIPLIRTTYHVANYDSLACIEENDEYEHIFSNTITTPESYIFDLRTKRRTGEHVLGVANNAVAVQSASESDVTGQMNLADKDLAEVRLIDAFGKTPTWCHISAKDAHTITVTCTQSGIRTPRSADLYIAYIVTIGTDMRFVNFRLTVSQPSLFAYANNQYLVHNTGASGDPLDAKGMQQVHQNKRILYYYPDQNVELPVREKHFFGWWRWFREGEGEIGDSDIPEEVWRKKPVNSSNYSFPFRIIGDSVDDPERPGRKKLVTMGRYTVFHYKASQYSDWRANPPIKTVAVAPPVTEYGVAEAEKPVVTYAVDISNYYDGLPMSTTNKNQVDTARLDTMDAIPEPTLSLREIFELHPWTEMADTLDHYKSARTANDAGAYPLASERYMEDHIVMAPLGNKLLLSTEQRYNGENVDAGGHSESLLGYYMHDDNWATGGWTQARKDTMIWCGGWDADCKWYTYNHKTQKYTPCDYTITQNDDFLQVTAKNNIPDGQEFDTIYYCLRARSWATTGDPGTSSERSDSGAYMFNICRYMIIYHNPEEYGPKLERNGKALITNDEIEQRYEVLERLNFDYNKPGANYTVYPHPLPWADASYGYTYPETPDLPHNRPHSQSDLPNFGEYGLINRIHYTDYWYDMQQHGGAENGYMIYCDGMSSSGQVAALSLSVQLCSGQKMFFSCYVGNPSSQKNQKNLSKPNFIFEVQGSIDGNIWEDITSYMTGDIDTSSSWYQIYFPIIFNNAKEYGHFRVRIYNMASSWDGNDFVIDDMCIFATKPPLIAYQANTSCKEQGEEEKPTHVLLRVDYQGITGEGYNNKSVYYTVKRVSREGVHSFVPMLDHYLAEDATHTGRDSKPDTICGRLYIPSLVYEPSDPDSIFVNMNELLDAFDASNGAFKEGYIFESLEGDIRPVKYVVHHAMMDPVDTFTVHMSAEFKELMSSLCGMTSYLKVSSQMVLELNGEELENTEQNGLCANATYDIGLRVKGSLYMDSVAPISLNGTCVNDWLLYGDTAEATSLARYGYKYSDIVKVVKDILRCVPPGITNANQFAPNLAAVSRNEMTRIQADQDVTLSVDKHPYDILADLVNKGYLLLYQSNITATVYSGDSVQCVIFPILGTGSDAMHEAAVEVCPQPILIKLKPNPESAKSPLIVGGLHRDPSEMNQPIVVLASTVDANHEITLKVDSIMPMVGIRSVELLSTDDPDYREGIHSLTYTPEISYPSEDYYTKGNDIVLRPSSTNNYYMKQGYTYTFGLVMQTALGKDTLDGGCPVGTVPFTISVVPDYLRWDPQDETSTQWNNPGNWIGINNLNQPIAGTNRFAPLASTNVIIPAITDGRPYPEMPDLSATATYDSVQQVGFTYNTCDNIRFLPGAAISQQQRIEYTNAIVDMAMPHNQWAFRSAPVKGMLSGDIFMADADINQETSPWEVGEFDAAGRTHKTGNASYWLSLYSTSTYYKGNGATTKDSTYAADAEWSKVTNGTTLSLPPAQGFAIYARTRSGNQAAVRLPKNDDIYYYYDTNGDKILELYEHNLQATRETNAAAAVTGGHAGELAFTPGREGTSASYTLTKGVGSTTFVFGNPTMGYIDIWGFIADNDLVEESGYMGSNNEYTTVSKTVAEALPGSPDEISNPKRYLPPMHAILVTAKASGTSLSVTVNTNRVLTSPAKKVRAGAPRRVSGSKLPKGIMTVTATNTVSPRCQSRLLLGQGYNDAIYEGEDALLTTLSIDNYTNNTKPATPFNLYAAEGDYGLCIDLRDSIVNIPLSFSLSDLPFDPITRLWFTGVNAISDALVLYDAATDTERPIADGISLDIQTPEQSHEVRYYIRRRGYNAQSGTNIATGIEPAQTDNEQVVKFIKDGHVYILRRGQVYTIVGQRVQ